MQQRVQLLCRLDRVTAASYTRCMMANLCIIICSRYLRNASREGNSLRTRHSNHSTARLGTVVQPVGWGVLDPSSVPQLGSEVARIRYRRD